MNRIQHRIGFAVLAGISGAAVLAAGVSVAQAARRGKNNKNSGQQQQQQQQDDTPPSDGPVVPGPSAVDNATHNVTLAQTDYDTFVAAQKAVFEQSPDYLAAKEAVDKDQAALDAILAPLRDKLKANDDSYSRALDDIIPAKQRLTEAIAAKKPDDIKLHIAEVNYYQEMITKAEAPIFAKNSAVKTAKAQLDADTKKFAAMPDLFQGTLDKNPDYKALAQALANAKAQLAVAQGAASTP